MSVALGILLALGLAGVSAISLYWSLQAADPFKNEQHGKIWIGQIWDSWKESFAILKYHISELSDKQKSVLTWWENNTDFLENWWTTIGNACGTFQFIIPHEVYQVGKLWAYAIKQGWLSFSINDTADAQDITDVKAMSDALGFPSSQFERAENPASVTTWATLAVIYTLLAMKVPMIRISMTPNIGKNLTAGTVDGEGQESWTRSQNDYFIVPVLPGSLTEDIDFATGHDYPPGGSDWETFKNNNNKVTLPKITGGYNTDATSTDFAKCIKNYTITELGEITLNWDIMALSALGISRVMLLPTISNNIFYSSNPSMLHSQSAYGVGESALKQFPTDTFIGGGTWLASWGTYYVTRRNSSDPLPLPRVTKYPMESNDKTGGTTNLAGVSNPDWNVTFSAIQAKGGVAKEDNIEIFPDSSTADAIQNGSLEVLTPGVVRDAEGNIIGDRTITIPKDFSDVLSGVLSGTLSIADAIAGIGSLADIKTGAIIGNPAISIPDAIEDIDTVKPGGVVIPVIPPTNPGISANDFLTIYLPTNAQMSALAGKLWSNDLIDGFFKAITEPMDAIISYQMIAMYPKSGGSTTLKLGNYNTGITMNRASSQYTTANLGSVLCSPKFSNFLDTDYTIVQLFLPFIGFIDLNTKEVMGKNISVVYSAEILSGSCLASVSANGTVIGTYTGQVSMQLPVTGKNYASAYTAIAKGFAEGAAIGGAVGAGIGATVGLLSEKTQRSGQFSTNSGFLGSYRPYLVIGRPIPDAGSFQNVIGYVSNKTGTIGSFSGFCQFREVQLSGCSGATLDELQQIKTMLKEGVIL